VVFGDHQASEWCWAAFSNPVKQLQRTGVVWPSCAAAGGEIGLEEITRGDQIANPPNAIGKSLRSVWCVQASRAMGGAGWIDRGGRCGKGIQQGRHGAGVGSFDPEVLVLEIETKNWVMPCNPKAWHGIGTPDIAGSDQAAAS
jgi:hypothetical protein